MLTSTCPLSKTAYQIPTTNDNRLIDDFISLFPERKVVAVQGLGFVGAAMSIVVANAQLNYRVIGVDLPTPSSFWKIGRFQSGQMPISSSDPKLADYFANVKRKNNFLATHDSYAFSKADVIIVDINLDVQKTKNNETGMLEYDVDLENFKTAIKSIGTVCKEDVLILVESTVPPGMCVNVIYPLLKELYFERGLDVEKLKLAHSYERVMPGDKYVDSIENFYRVYSGVSQESADAAQEFLQTIIKTDIYPLTRLENTTATEMAKVLENSYRAANIAFIQEWTEFAENAGVDLYDIISAIKMRPTHNNIMRPGLGVGGYCLTKDPLLASWASEEMFGGHVLEKSVRSVSINDSMPNHTFNKVMEVYGSDISGKKVLILGVSYLNDVGDTRFTPVEPLYDALLAHGADIFLFDPYLPIWAEREKKVFQSLEEVCSILPLFDICILSTAHKRFLDADVVDYLGRSGDANLIDTMNFYAGVEGNKLIENRIVIGKGN